MSVEPVEIMEWTPEYSVHVEEIDREHQFEFGLVSCLHKAMLAGQGAEILGTLLAELAEFTMNHFANEEKIMVAMRYPEMLAHVQQHEGLRRRVTDVVARFERGETAVTIELMLFLTDWLRNHTMVTDHRLGDFIQVEKCFNPYLDLLLQGDSRGCGLIVQRLLAEGISFKGLYVNLFQRAMYSTGELWMRNKISVAAEHLATTITAGMMTLVHPTLFDSPRNGKKAVVTCVAGELHALGAQMVSDTFEFLGWDSFFLGANTPVDALLDLIGEKQPDVLCLSVTLGSHMGQFKETVRKTRARFPELDILAGGQALPHDTAEVSSDPQLRFLHSLDELEAWITAR
jgi:hemerythrin-like metal-binding protein